MNLPGGTAPHKRVEVALSAGTASVEQAPSTGFRRSLWTRQLSHYPNTGPRTFYLGVTVLATIILYYEFYLQGAVATQIIQNYHGHVGATDTGSHNPNYRGNFAMSYVTGAHSFKTGFDLNGAFRVKRKARDGRAAAPGASQSGVTGPT